MTRSTQLDRKNLNYSIATEVAITIATVFDTMNALKEALCPRIEVL